MINNVSLTGRLTRDIELKYAQPSGTAVGSFSLAVNRQFKKEGRPDADFINCIVWGKTAENLSKYTHKGSLIGVEGRIQTRNYDNQQGQKVYITEVIVERFAFLETRKAIQEPQTWASPEETNKQAKQSPQPNPAHQQVTDSDLPF